MVKYYNKGETYSNLNTSHMQKITHLKHAGNIKVSVHITSQHSKQCRDLQKTEFAQTTLQNICRNLFAKQYENQRAEDKKKNCFKSACLRGPNLYGQTIWSISLKFCL